MDFKSNLNDNDAYNSRNKIKYYLKKKEDIVDV